jgi:HlyD family secretion protein
LARLVPVVLGQRSGLEVEIASGLGQGEDIVTHPSDRVRDGVRVTAH